MGGARGLVAVGVGAMLAASTAVGRPAPPVAAADPGPVITVYGAPGTFRTLNASATGHSLVTAPVTAMSYEPGATTWFAEVTRNGRVVTGTQPFTNNFPEPTQNTQSIGVLDPDALTFESIRTPTSKGFEAVAGAFSTVGGADVMDVCVLDEGTPQERIVTTSAHPHHHWNPTTYGDYSVVNLFADDGDAVVHTPRTADVDGARTGGSWITNDLRASPMPVSPPAPNSGEWPAPDPAQTEPGDLAFPWVFSPVFPSQGWFADSRGLGECDVLPGGLLVAVQYNINAQQAQTSGAVVVIDVDTGVVAHHQFPNYVVPATGTKMWNRATNTLSAVAPGTPIKMWPREVQADPASPAGDQRFVVMFDVVINGNGGTFPMQELSFDGSGTITPTSSLVFPDDVADPTLIYSKGVYAPDGTFLAGTGSFGFPFANFVAGPMHAFSPGTLAANHPWDPGTGWQGAAEPDAALLVPTWTASHAPERAGASLYSLTYDDESDRVIGVTISGLVRMFDWDPAAAPSSARGTVYCDADVGYSTLRGDLAAEGVTSSPRQAGFDRGAPAVPGDERLYVPLQAFDATEKLPTRIDQFIVGVDLAQLTSATRTKNTSCGLPCVTPFSEVPGDHLFCVPIAWLAASGITAGFTDGTFRPTLTVSRQAVASWFHNAAGQPPAPPDAPTFTDVPPEHPFYEPISWFAASGITSGFPDGTFRPTLAVSRQTIAAFFHSAAGSPPIPPGGPTFSDVPLGHPFYGPIEWFAATNITEGYPDGTYRPKLALSRQGIASFFMRYDELGS